MSNDKVVKKDNAGDMFFMGVSFVFTILVFPMVLGILVGRGFNSIVINKSFSKAKVKWKMWLKLGFLMAFLLVSILIPLFLGGFSSSTISLYDWVVPVALEGKILLSLISGEHVDVIAILSTFPLLSIIVGVWVFPILYLLRPVIKRHYLEAIAYYNKKLENDEVGVDPSKDVSMGSHLLFFIVGLHRSTVEQVTLTESERGAMKKTHIMLDRRYGIPRKGLKQHLAILGTTGSGKTETTFKFITDSVVHNKPTILVDGKGDIDNIFRAREIAVKNKKPFYVFTLDGRTLSKEGEEDIKPNTYNPFASDNEGILVDGLMALFDYSEEHYKAGARVYMDIMIKTMLVTKTPVSWDNIIYYLDKFKLIELLKSRYEIDKTPEEKEIKEGKISLTKANTGKDTKNWKYYTIDIQQLNNIDPKAIGGFSSRIGMFYNTTRETITADGFTLEDTFKTNGVVIFSLNSLDYQEQATAIGKLIVNNIKANAEINAKLKKQTTIALDEFNVFANENIIDILNKTRSKGYEVILSFQSLDDLTKISESFKNQVIENTNSKIIHRTNDPDGADYLASVLGTKKKHKKTYVAMDEETTGGQSVRVVDEYIAHPNVIKNLKVGEAFAKYTLPSGELFVTPHKIKILLED